VNRLYVAECSYSLGRAVMEPWAHAGLFPGVGKLKGLEDGSFPAGFGGGTPVRAWGEAPKADDMY